MEVLDVDEESLREHFSNRIKSVEFYTVNQNQEKQVQVFSKKQGTQDLLKSKHRITFKESLFEGNDLLVQMIFEFDYDSSWAKKVKKPHQIEINLSSSDEDQE